MYGYEVFHEDILKSLILSLRQSHTQHAYIFEGDSGLGKKNAATLFAAALCCENTPLAPCGTCPSCIGARAFTNPDIKYINSGDKKSIGVDIMREIVTDAYIRPFESAKKVYIIEDAHLLTEQAQNSFLKILEEPPQYTVFLILVPNSSFFLQTVISRCTTIQFMPLKKERIKEYVENKYPNSDINFLTNYAEGNPGRVDFVMNKDNFFVLRSLALKMLTPLLSHHLISSFKIADFIEENKDDSSLIFQMWQSMLRDITLIQNHAGPLVTNSDLLNSLSEIAGRVSPELCLTAQDLLLKAVDMHRRYVNLRAIALNLSLSIKKAAISE